MSAPLPSKYYQRRKMFRPSYEDVIYAYNAINKHIFDKALRRPIITLGQPQKCWAYCQWNDTVQYNGSYCNIFLSNKWFCQQWFLNTLAHEMVHQYQWDVYRWEHLDYYGKPMFCGSGAHGPSFFEWREEFAYYGLTLKTAFGQKRWFKYQDFNRC